MRKMNVFVACVVALLGATLASAQATRTWVSGVGDDANPCSRTAPCKTFAGAISKTAPGGEIDALDPGGFGALTITKSITLDGGGGQVASVLVAGTNGIVVAAGATDVVTIRNMRLDGLLGNGGNAGNAGINGIRFISGQALNIQNCVIFGFNNAGIDIEPTGGGGKITVRNTISHSNKVFGIFVNGTAANNAPTADVEDSHFDENGVGGGLGAGLWVGGFSTVSVRSSGAAENSGAGFVAAPNAGGGPAELDIYNSSTANNAIGVQAGTGAGGTALINLSGVLMNGNAAGFLVGGGGTINSYKNNYNTSTINTGSLGTATPQ